MAKQKGKIKAQGTVDENLNFYKTRLGDYLARMLPGVSSDRFWEDPAFEGSRRSAQRFGTGNIMSSILYRFVPIKRRYSKLFPLLRTLSIVCLKQGMAKEEVFTAIYTFLEEQKRISLTREQFLVLLSSFEVELAQRLHEPRQDKVNKQMNQLHITVEAPLSEEDIELLELYMDDYDWKISFEGVFPPDYKVPLFLLKHAA